MAMSLPHQIGAISKSQLTMESSAEHPVILRGRRMILSVVWKSPRTTNLRVSVQKTGQQGNRSVSPSPPLSPRGRFRPDLSVAAQVLMSLPTTADDAVDLEYVATIVPYSRWRNRLRSLKAMYVRIEEVSVPSASTPSLLTPIEAISVNSN